MAVSKRKAIQGKITREAALEAAEASMGIASECARRLGISRPTLARYRRQWPEIDDALRDSASDLVDFAASKLIDNIANGDQRAIEFALEHNGGRDGWGPAVQKMDINSTVQLTVGQIVKAAQETWEEGRMLKP